MHSFDKFQREDRHLNRLVLYKLIEYAYRLSRVKINAAIGFKLALIWNDLVKIKSAVVTARLIWDSFMPLVCYNSVPLSLW